MRIDKSRIVAIVKGSVPQPSDASAEGVANRVIHAFKPLYQELDRKEKLIDKLQEKYETSLKALLALVEKAEKDKKKRLGIF